jgi:hypothetical protein
MDLFSNICKRKDQGLMGFSACFYTNISQLYPYRFTTDIKKLKTAMEKAVRLFII